jgi:hypothetical protein
MNYPEAAGHQGAFCDPLRQTQRFFWVMYRAGSQRVAASHDTRGSAGTHGGGLQSCLCMGGPGDHVAIRQRIRKTFLPVDQE